MIIDRMENIGCCAGLGGAFGAAVEWLRNTDLSALADGRHDVVGDEVFATLSVNRLSAGEPKFEAHRRYADIQVILEGKERFLYGMDAVIPPPKPDTDFYPCEAVRESVDFVLGPGMFTVFLPGEAHAPGNAAPGGPETCRKAVIKVLMSQE